MLRIRGLEDNTKLRIVVRLVAWALRVLRTETPQVSKDWRRGRWFLILVRGLVPKSPHRYVFIPG